MENFTETYLTTREAAKRLKVSPRAVQMAVERGDLRAYSHGNTFVIPIAELERFAATRRGRGRPPKKTVN